MAEGGQFVLGDALINIMGKVAPGLNTALGEAEKQVKRGYGNILAASNTFGRGLQSVGSSLMKIGGIATGVVTGISTAFAAVILKTGEYGDDIEEMSQRTGFGTDALQELNYAAKQTGGNLEGLDGMAKRMAKSIDAMNTQTQDAADKTNKMGAAIKKTDPEFTGAALAIQRLGIRYSELKNLKPEDQFFAIARRLAEVKDPTTRAAIALQIFGRSGTDMLPMLTDGAKGLDEFRRQAHALGLVMDQEAIKSAGEFNDNLQTVKDQIAGIARQVAAPFLKPLADFLKNQMTPRLIEFTKWVQQNGGAIKIWAEGKVAYVTDRLKELWTWLSINRQRIFEIGATAFQVAAKWGPLTIAIGFAASYLGSLVLGINAFIIIAPKIGAAILAMLGQAGAAGAVGTGFIGLAAVLALLVGAGGLLVHFNDTVYEFLNDRAPKLAIALDTIGATIWDIYEAIKWTSKELAELIKQFAEWVRIKAGKPGQPNPYYIDPSSASGFAGGGITPGGLSLVGERGPELAMLPAGTRVFSNTDSESMIERAFTRALSKASGGGGNITLNVHTSGNLTPAQAYTVVKQGLRMLKERRA